MLLSRNAFGLSALLFQPLGILVVLDRLVSHSSRSRTSFILVHVLPLPLSSVARSALEIVVADQSWTNCFDVTVNYYRPHRTYYVSIDAVYCYRPSSVVCRSVCHTCEPCENGWTDRDAVMVEESSWWRPDPPGEGAILRGKGASHSIGTRCGHLCKKLNRSRCRLGFGLGWTQWIVC